jgi:hypothetical protein
VNQVEAMKARQRAINFSREFDIKIVVTPKQSGDYLLGKAETINYNLDKILQVRQKVFEQVHKWGDTPEAEEAIKHYNDLIESLIGI